MILACETCIPHAYQDQKYGPRMRVHTRTKQGKAPKVRRWRCTVCRQERD